MPPRVPEAAFDLDDRWALHPSVALRPEPFGALAYHFGNRRLSFLKSRALVAVIEGLAGAPSGRAACEAAGVAPEELGRYEKALGALAASGMLVRAS
jgi:putative mycofactocin binding protein MftB